MSLNATASRAAKDAGQQLAFSFAEAWAIEVLRELRGWLAIQKSEGVTTMTLEQFRAVARNQPDSHKAWGALPRVAVGAGLIAPMSHPDGSPVMRPAESLRTHAHPVRVWRIA